jgi:phage baseplate assembly protein W
VATAAPFTWPFPFATSTDGSTARDTTSLSQIRCIFNVAPGQSIHDRDYGSPAYKLRQAPIITDEEKVAVQAVSQRQIARYIKSLVLLGHQFIRVPGERRLVLEFEWAEKRSLNQQFRARLAMDLLHG